MSDFQRISGRRFFSRGVGAAAAFSLLPMRAFAGSTDIPVHSSNAASVPGVIDIQGHFPRLNFKMERVSDGKAVTAGDYRGDVVIIYFGFTRCSDTCPLTALNAARLFALLGMDKTRVRFLFVTVDLDYDTPTRLKRYLADFGPPPYIDGLHGTIAELNAFAKRYGVYFKTPTGPDTPDPVSAIRHSDAVYLFGPQGEALAIINDFGGGHPNLNQLARRIKTLLSA